jgi:hypothetical protein
MEEDSGKEAADNSESESDKCSSIFAEALLRYIDETKPDLLARQQLSNLHLEWTPLRKTTNDNPSLNNDDVNQNSQRIEGELTVYGEYVVICLHVLCEWEWEWNSDESLLTRNSSSRMHLCMWVHGNLISKTDKERRRGKTQGEELTRKDQRINEKVQAKVIKRIQADPYIQRILNKESEPHGAKNEGTHLLCEALIKKTVVESKIGDQTLDGKTPSSDISDLEEKVYVSSDLLEGFKRSVCSKLDSNISAVEFLLEMPYLPKKYGFSNVLLENMTGKGYCHPFREPDMTEMLAGRIQLRILEDVTIDECEKEGENDLLSDLSLSERNDSDNEAPEEINKKSKRKKDA